MNIALIGYGKMGREIERVAKERGITVAAIFDVAENPDGSGLTGESLKSVDVCIDFSSSEAVVENIRRVADCGKNIVVGTTGWHDRLEDVKAVVKSSKIGLLHSSNFSLGVNIFLQVVMDAARHFNKYPGYDVAITETHHTAKADAPSGTALSLGAAVLKEFTRKTDLFSETSHGKMKPTQLHVTSTRLGSTVGKHAVVFDSEADTIELIHTAKSRAGFALGAVVAAEWLKGKKGVYTMRDVVMS
jgi:4-hydroxy-tetrahydrodipicolinate reductase